METALELADNNHALKERESTESLIQLVSFTLDKEEFGIDILKVQEINRTPNITRVPNCPDFIEGVINLRGRIVPIIDLRKRFGMRATEQNKDTRIIVVEVLSKVVGFIVDSVSEVLRIPHSVIDAPPALVAGIRAEFIEGIGKLENRLLILLNLEKILSSTELQTIDTAIRQ